MKKIYGMLKKDREEVVIETGVDVKQEKKKGEWWLSQGKWCQKKVDNEQGVQDLVKEADVPKRGWYWPGVEDLVEEAEDNQEGH